MKIEELENKIKAFQNEIVKLQEEVEKMKEEKKNKRWRAEKSNKYYFIDSNNCVNVTYETNSIGDNCKYNTFNYFQTKEEAQAVADNIKTHIELIELAEELNTEPVDWKNGNQHKFYLYYHEAGNQIDRNCAHFWKNANTIYCTNENFRDEAIKRIGEKRLIRYFKGE